MKFRLCVLGIVIIILCIPYIRLFFKRLSLLSKIKNACREKGYRLQGMHPFWFLGGKSGKRCDCSIETAEEVLAIKLFGMPRRRRVLVFTEKREYFTRILVGMLLLIRESFDSKAKQLPEYDFTCVNKEALDDKKIRKIHHPLCFIVENDPQRKTSAIFCRNDIDVVFCLHFIILF